MTILPAIWILAEETASPGGLAAIGVDPKALLFQIVNFAILFWVLKKVAYKPILGVLEDRRKKIEESLATAERLEKQQAEWELKQAQLLKEARAEAAEVIAKSRKEATDLIGEASNKAQVQAKQLIEDAQGKISQELAEARHGLKKDMTKLVVEATEVILRQKLDDKTDKALIEKTLAEVSK
jgi:F-type H+-transporting ATPase subunit b